ncbi:hypothetical protein [Flavobacterium aquidurense]|uniref:Uncharacterized protein n=1 Tax=Flavobacterium aquidurense TaxID=362413 RepID=A0A0Q0SE64_9FLAO|nr:hypothetical protein [Flavobacterium aquidurense]KQB42667.1 hypothetical protein RC62_3674 [Flavobacterium aquidurense]
MNYEEKENHNRYGKDFQETKKKMRTDDLNSSSLYHSITTGGEHELCQYFRNKCSSLKWDDEDLFKTKNDDNFDRKDKCDL